MDILGTGVKRQKTSKPLVLSVATNGTNVANWRDPKDQSHLLSNDLQSWITFAKLAEKGKLHNIFVIDHLTWFDTYDNSFEKAAKVGVNVSKVDPFTAIGAMALNTTSLGFAITASTISEHPFHFARRLASIDQLTGGRVGWNVVASYLNSTAKNLLNGSELPEHDERYSKTEEYLDAVYGLLLSSWRDDAVVYDKVNGILNDPSRMREINHKGKYYDILGPALTEPTPQRFPVILQAGASDRGILFAAENAEVIYVSIADLNDTRENVVKIRKLAKEKFNRDPYSIKFIAAVTPFVGATEREATQKYEDFKRNYDPDYALVYFSGSSGIDVAKFGLDDPVIPSHKLNGVQSVTKTVLKKKGAHQTPREIAESWRPSDKFSGTGEQISESLKSVVDATDIDGFNFHLRSFPEGLEDIVELLIPALQKSGLAQKEYTVPGGTFRENLYGAPGQSFLPENHPAYKLRWDKNKSKSQFEKELTDYTQLRDKQRF